MSSFVKSTVEVRYFGLLQDCLIKVLGAPCDIVFSITQQSTLSTTGSTASPIPLFEDDTSNDVFVTRLTSSRIHPARVFENFAVSSSNQMAWAAAEAVAKQPASAYNPLFIWGGVGVGKSHLMNAVGYTVLKRHLDTKVLLCTGEDFTNDIITGIRTKSMQSVREKYRKLHILGIDDIQFIAGKDTAQEEFFHTFNAIVSAGGQVILTSDRPPQEISKLEERLRSRFEAGLIVDISAPDYELRCAIIQIKARERGIDMDPPLVNIIASNLDSARKIEGFLIRLMSEVKLRNLEITQDLLVHLLGSPDDRNGGLAPLRKQLTSDTVIDAVCTHFSVSKRAIMGKARARLIARPRQILMYLLRTEMHLPLEEVGQLAGGRDHTTVMHAVDTITQLASNDTRIREHILGIKQSL
jgi:chromosomal replication initiator protein